MRPWPRRAPLAALVALGLGSLAFDLTLPLRLPTDEDWARAAASLRERARPGDAVQLWPPWADRARAFVEPVERGGPPLTFEEDLAAADWVGIRRVWLLGLPRVPFGGLAGARAALAARGAQAEAQRFGALSLEAFELRGPALVAELFAPGPFEEQEVGYVPRRCGRIPIGGVVRVRALAGARLHLRGGVIGERAFDAGRPPIDVRVSADGLELGVLTVPPADDGMPAWRRLDVDLPAGAPEREFVLAVQSPDANRPFCLRAWTTR